MFFTLEDNLTALSASHDHKTRFRWKGHILLSASQRKHKNSKHFSELLKVSLDKAFAVEAQSVYSPDHQDVRRINMLE